MLVSRVYVDAPLTTGSRVTLQGAAASHVTRVLRLRVGEALTVFNGSGGEYAASIEHARGGTVAVAIGEARSIARASPMATATVPPRACSMLAAYSPPEPLNTVSASPTRRRSTRVTWLAAAPCRVTRLPVVSGASTYTRLTSMSRARCPHAPPR